MIDTISYKGKIYPALQSQGFAAQYAFPFAAKYCTGLGFDVGCMKEEWKYSDSIAVDPALNVHDAMHLPFFIHIDGSPYDIPKVDYIFSSHCIEHLDDWVAALDYWATRIKSGGVLFLYLPNMDFQTYWQPQNNRKHKHYINPIVLKNYFNDRVSMWRNDFVTWGEDLNSSFYAIAERI